MNHRPSKKYLMKFRMVILGYFVLSLIFMRVGYVQDQKVLRISLPVDMGTFDPALTRSVEEDNVFAQIFEGLTVYDPKTCMPSQGVSKKWVISKDLLTYTFYLRNDAKWSDGSKVTAYDFVYGWKRLIDRKIASPWSFQLFNIKNAKNYYEEKIKDFSLVGIKAKDDETLVVELEKPQPYFLALLAHPSMSPIKSGIVETLGNEWTKPLKLISNGAFTLAYFEPRDRIVLKKNPFYWESNLIKINEVQYFAIENEETALKMYETDMLDINSGDPPIAKIPFMKSRKDFRKANYLGVYFYRLNTKKEPFNDLNVRKAFNLVIDKRIITDKILKGGQKPAYNFVPEGIISYSPPKGDVFNPSRARELFSKAGFCVKGFNTKDCKEFPKIEILFNTLGGHKNIAEAIQSMLKDNLGLDSVELVNKDFKTVQALTKVGDFQMVRGGWAADYVDPTTFLYMWQKDSANNLTGWSDNVYDQLIAQAENTIDIKKRAKFYSEAEKILNDQLPFIPIYFYVRHYLIKDYVKGYFDNILDKHPLKYVYISK